MNPEELIQAIRDAFNDVKKGDGIGLREAGAIDDYASAEEQQAARHADVEEYWWELKPRFEHELGTALSFTDQEGFKFLLPAAMTEAIRGNLDDAGSIHFHLCYHRYPYVSPPHHGHREYVAYMRGIHPKEVVEYYGFTPEQVRVIALFFKWYMAYDSKYLYGDQEQARETQAHLHERFIENSRPGDYVLTLDDVEQIYREECRILTEWLELGRVAV